jgi:hypothetical protein
MVSPSSEPKRAPRRRSKPKFEVPAEVAAATPPAWVYRHDAPARPASPEASSFAVIPPAFQPAIAPPNPAPERPATPFPDPTMVMLAAIETMAITVAAANRMFLAAASLMGAPIEVTRKILGL